MNRFAPLLATIAVALHGPVLAQAPAWPQKPVRVLVGLAPGGNPDTLARMLAAKWGDAFGKQLGDSAARSGAVLGDGLLAECVAPLCREHARERVRIAAGREPYEDAHGFLRPGRSLREHRPVQGDGDRREQGCETIHGS